ncbi:hypothetical protein GCM10017559_70330 [Streptosporangium longisporum]|uniref:Uncharacterized protein n=1 Tax=Streptosporangium longisporum TaxID=46187 RepID=A0ABP6L7T5_9ACTN
MTFGQGVTVDVSPLPETRLGGVLKEFGTSNESDEDVRDTQELLSEIGRGVGVVAVAELAEPMPEAKVLGEEEGLSQPEGVLLSSGGDRPLGNSLYCGHMCRRGSWQQSYTTTFQEWISTLRSQDRAVLQAFGLNLEHLRATSRQGRIHGLIYENYDARMMLEISKNPKVKALYVADVNLRCASEAGGTCRPTGD